MRHTHHKPQHRHAVDACPGHLGQHPVTATNTCCGARGRARGPRGAAARACGRQGRAITGCINSAALYQTTACAHCSDLHGAKVICVSIRCKSVEAAPSSDNPASAPVTRGRAPVTDPPRMGAVLSTPLPGLVRTPKRALGPMGGAACGECCMLEAYPESHDTRWLRGPHVIRTV